MNVRSVGHRVSRTGDRLVVRESLRVQLLLLGSYVHRVVVDGSSKTITVEQRSGWLRASRQKIPFADVRAVTYGYRDLARSPAAAFSGSASESYDHFSVGLRLVD